MIRVTHKNSQRAIDAQPHFSQCHRTTSRKQIGLRFSVKNSLAFQIGLQGRKRLSNQRSTKVFFVFLREGRVSQGADDFLRG
jgi:hypothetical protein